MYRAKIFVTLKTSILDPKGKATFNALANLGFESVKNVRIGKMFDLEIEADSKEKAYETAENATKKLLANDVMEDYSIEISGGK
jgi:phosphoribosylformylglycinamidine synthase PurS subunit